MEQFRMSPKNTIMMTTILLQAALLPAQNGSSPVPAIVASKVPAVAGVTGAVVRANDGDKVLASWLQVACSNEITLAGVALKQGQNSDVRAFAQAVIDANTAFVAKLKPYAPAASDVPDEAFPHDAAGKKTTTPARELGVAKPFDHVALIRDLGKKCLQSQSAMLAAKTGADFDRCYMQMQVAAHGRSADMIEVFETYATEPMRAVLVDGRQAVTKHLERATRLCQQVCEPTTESKVHQSPVRKAP
jgi:predicted outer membrane protein